MTANIRVTEIVQYFPVLSMHRLVFRGTEHKRIAICQELPAITGNDLKNCGTNVNFMCKQIMETLNIQISLPFTI